MTDNGPNESVGPVAGSRPPSADSAQALRLRTERPKITRLSRKVLAGGSALALLLIAGAVLWGLRSNHSHNPAPGELYSTDHHNVADGLTTLRGIMPGFPTIFPGMSHHCQVTWGVRSEQWKANHRRSASTQNNNAPTRKPRRLGPVRYLRRRPGLSRRSMPLPRKSLAMPRHLLMKPSPRTGRIANCCLSMPRSIGGRQRPIVSRVQLLPLSCKQERSFLQRSLQVSDQTFPDKSPRKLRSRFLILLLVASSWCRKEHD